MLTPVLFGILLQVYSTFLTAEKDTPKDGPESLIYINAILRENASHTWDQRRCSYRFFDLGLVMAQLTAKQLNQLPGQPKQKLLHATRDGFDHALVLHRALHGSYRSLLPKSAPGRGYLQIEASNWRLVGVTRSPGESQIRVFPSACAAELPVRSR